VTRDYVDSDRWAECVRPDLLRHLGIEKVGLLHRHWMWAEYQRARFAELPSEQGAEFESWHLIREGWSTLLLWYALLWAVIESFQEQGLKLEGPFQEDIEAVSADLRDCRNAVLHVSRHAYLDRRIMTWIGRLDSAERIRRIHRAFGRLLLEEVRRSEALREGPSPPSD